MVLEKSEVLLRRKPQLRGHSVSLSVNQFEVEVHKVPALDPGTRSPILQQARGGTGEGPLDGLRELKLKAY